MSKSFVFKVFGLILLGGLFFGIYDFCATGGIGLYRIVVNDLLSDNPDKNHTWQDFVYKGSGSMVKGFYAGGDANSVSIWTLSGKKRFYEKPGTSVYYFRDTCQAVKQAETTQKATDNSPVVYFDVNKWNKEMKRENFVVIQVLDRENGTDVIDSAWGVSGRYKILGRVEAGVCD